MPFPNYHAARLKNQDDFIKESFVTKPIENGNILLILGKLKADGAEGSLKTQAIRFKSSKYTVAQAKEWLKEHDHKPILFEEASGKADETEKLFKTFKFSVTETKEFKTDKGHFGIIKGYASTYGNLDRGGEIVLSGAFKKSIERYKECDRPIKMQFQHNGLDIIGGFPCDLIQEDEKGLFVEGQINLDVQRGREVYALAKQGVLTDMSIGYSVYEYEFNDDGNKLLKELELWEISVVGEPMNPEATITSVKSANAFVDLPLSDMEQEWDSEAAIERVRDFTRSDDHPSAAYKNGFAWYNKEKANEFDAYKLPYVDVVDGEMKAIPRAIFAIAAVMRGARGGLDIPAEDKTKIVNNINKYYEKMGLESPLKSYYDNTVTIKDINYVSSKTDVDYLLKNYDVTININDCRKSEEDLCDAGFSRKAAKLLVCVYRAGLRDAVQTEDEDKNDEVFRGLNRVRDEVRRLKSLLKK